MPKTIEPRQTVTEFWSRMQANDFRSAGELFSDDFVSHWPLSSERVHGRENWVAIQEYYPANGRWVFTIRSLLGEGGQIVCDFSVTDGVQQGQSVTYFTVEHGQITAMIEYWWEPYEPPIWRSAFVEKIVS